MSNAHGKFSITLTESKTTRTVGNFPRGSREAPERSVSREADRSEKARCRKSDVHVSGESNSFIVPKKRANKGALLPVIGVGVGTRRFRGRCVFIDGWQEAGRVAGA
jgi:hypothetical protein